MDEINNLVESMKDELVKSVQEVVRIKSVMDEPKEGMPFGEGVNKALMKALSISSSLGFKTVNVDGYMGYAEYGEGEETIGVLGHLDVVPEGSGWKYPPYGGEIHDGKIYARGAIDDKGPIMAALFGLKAIKEANIQLGKKVRIFFGTNEENGSNDVVNYLERDKAPDMGFTPDAEYPIIYAEKGILGFDIVKYLDKDIKNDINIKYVEGGNAPNVVPDTCKCAMQIHDDYIKQNVIDDLKKYIEKTGFDINYDEKERDILFSSKGLSAHGSQPELGENAIMMFLPFLKDINISDDLRKFVEFLVCNIGMDTRGRELGIDLKDETGELSLNVGMIKIDSCKAAVSVNIRYPVTFNENDVMDKLKSKAESYGLKIENLGVAHPLYFPKDHPLIIKLQKVYKEQTGLEPELLSIGGGTYAKKMPNIVAFGPNFPGKAAREHQTDEYVEIEDLIRNAQIYGNAIYELAK